MKGKVYLTGSGPGDEKLLTLKAVEVLARCDVVVYDYLANNIDLDKYAPQAEKIYVGKRSHHHILEQNNINDLLIKLAKEGKNVVRLKGGDPFIFGRGGEEAMELVEAGVDYEVVPGVSSVYAVPAYAGIPVTQRGYTSSLAVVTGHEKATQPDSDIDWQSLAKVFGTVVFIMGVKNLPKIVDKLLKYGKESKTPIALIRWGTTARQYVLTGMLEDIVEKVSLTKFKPPAIIVVGEVVALREQLKWFEKKPLFGKTVVITRSSKQSSKLTQALGELGANIIEIPTIKVMPPDSYEKMDKAIERQIPDQYYDWLIFTSANGVFQFADRLKQKKVDFRIFKGVKIAAIGSSTAASLSSLGVQADLIPKEYKGEGLVEALGNVKRLKILIPRAKVAREVLPEELKKAGAEVDVVDAYQTVVDAQSAKNAPSLNGHADIITFTSASTVTNFLKILGNRKEQFLGGVKIAAIGPITAEAAKKKGLNVNVVAKKYTIDGLVDAVVKLASES